MNTHEDISKIKKSISLFPYCGGKVFVTKYLMRYAPKHFVGYMEPFVGAGSFFSSLYPILQKPIILNDIHKDLIDAYIGVKYYLEDVIRIANTFEKTREAFLIIRDNQSEDVAFRAARFLYIITYAYGSVWDISAKGKLRSTPGNFRKKNFPDINTLTHFHTILQNVDIFCEDFEQVMLKYSTPCMFVYCDPPYIDTTGRSRRLYNYPVFSLDDHVRLAKTVDNLTEKGCFVMISNSYDPFTFELYKHYNIYSLEIDRSIITKHRPKEKRIKKEVIITNYAPEEI